MILNTHKITLYLLMIVQAVIGVALPAAAQKQTVAGGSVIDDFLEIPLPDTKVTLMSADSVPIRDIELTKFVTGEGLLDVVQFYATLDKGHKYLLRGSLEGYDDAWLTIDIPEDAPATYFPGDLRLQKHFSRDLDEVTVKATKVKMFWKGDTIVYNADAFNLPDGSMLDDLIRQMPGVTMNDGGEIFVNGRKIDELLLGSKSFFRGKSEVLLKNLPYYTVKNIKVYDKQSELSEAMGADVEPKKYVMDVNLASQYNRGIIANVEAAGGTSDRYLGRAFLLGFDDLFRFAIIGNINNVNETRHIGQSSSWTPEKMPKSQVTTRSVAGELKFDNNKVEETVNVYYTYTSDLMDLSRRSELFLNGLTPLSTMQSSTRDRSHRLRVQNLFRLKKPRMGVDFDYIHQSFLSGTEGISEQRDSTLISRISNFGHGNHNLSEINGRFWGGLNFNKGVKTYLNYSLDVRHEDERGRSMRQYEFEVPSASPLHNVNDYMDRKTKGRLWLNSIVLMKNNFRISATELIDLERSRKRDFLYHPDSLYLPSQKDALEAITDFNNSYDSRYSSVRYNTRISFSKTGLLQPDEILPIPYDYSIWEINLGTTPKTQSLHYRRAAIDTLARSTTVLFSPELTLNLFPTGSYGRMITLKASHSTEAPSLYDMIDYRDDSTPLIVKLGNPDLKGNQTSYAEANFYRRGAHQSLLHVGATFRYFHRSTAQSVVYDPVSATTTYRPVNVSGNYVANASFDMTRTFGKDHLWTWSDNTDATFDNSVDHSMLQGETRSHLNTVRTLTLHDGMYIQFSKGALNVRASGDVRWRHTTGRMRDFSTLNAVDFQYGMSARYTIPVLKTTISADGTMYSRRGYGSSSLNTNDFVMNASISQPMLKGKLVASVEAFDILHQLSQVNYEVNAQGRVETWYRSLPHYVMLHLVYNFNISPGKK